MKMNIHIKKTDIFIISVAVILLLIVVGIVILTLRANETPPPVQNQIPTPTSTSIVNAGVPPIAYDSDATDKIIEKVQNRKQLSEVDRLAKQKILSALPPEKTSGYVYQSSILRIEYLEAPDAFLIEIMTTNISKAKAEANVWLRSQGLSQKGICTIPISFYLNWEVAQRLRDKNIIFNPLPNSC